MEARKITVVNSRTQNRIEFQSTAETLGELKVDFSNNDIDYDGLAFFEGISKSEFTHDDAILPTNLPWKGARTNDLIFMLTEPQKKIRNGAVTSRIEAYVFIKENNLQVAAQKELGNNFTRCKTDDLITFCNKQFNKITTSTKTSEKKPTVTHKPIRKPSHTKTTVKETFTETFINDSNDMTLQKLIDLLVSKGIITVEEITNGIPTTTNSITTITVTDEDIDKMFCAID